VVGWRLCEGATKSEFAGVDDLAKGYKQVCVLPDRVRNWIYAESVAVGTRRGEVGIRIGFLGALRGEVDRVRA
jgi:hypothetical protein